MATLGITGNWSNRASSNTFDRSRLAFTADDLNAYFGNIATDPHYTRNELNHQLRTFGGGESVEFCPFSAELFISVVGRIRPTSPGRGEIPFWPVM